MNPFASRWPLESRQDWAGCDRAFEQLQEYISQRVNVCVLGPQGSGKSSLLNCFFSFPVRRRMAAEQHILVCRADLSPTADGEEMCQYLYDQLVYGVRRLLAGSSLQTELLAELEIIQSHAALTRLQQTIEMLHDYGYFILLVMDNFETFTSSPTITMNHHEVFRSLIEGGRLQCVVATDYDLSQDSLPADVRGSYFLQKFTGFLCMQPLTEEQAAAFIAGKQAGSPMQLDDRAIRTVHLLSGGVPWVLEAVAEAVFDSLEQGEGKLNGAQATRQAYQASLPIFRSWCKLLTEPQLEVLEQLAAVPGSNNQLARLDFNGQPGLLPAVATLCRRGLLRPVSTVDSQGRLRVPNEYEVSCNCLLFQQFCRQDEPRQAAAGNPLHPRPAQDQQEAQPVQPVQYQYIVHGNIYTNGAQDNSQTITAENLQIVQGITARQMLDMLGQSGSPLDFAQLLRRRMEGLALEAAPRPEALPETVYAQKRDEQFGQIGRQLLQDVEVDQEQDLVEVDPEDLDTLERRFDAARRKCRPALTDEMLARQSERCQFYLKMSVVVEDALGLLGNFMEEFSPQLVLYGKALEQALQDNLYELFHKEPRLRSYNPITRRDDPDGAETFGCKVPRRTYIGNYAYLIAGQKDYLDTLCCQNDLANPPAAGWKVWWDRLQSDIHGARMIRNQADHADDQAPDRDSLAEMCELLMGRQDSEGILDRLALARELARRLFPPALDPAEVNRLVGSVQEMQCTERKSNGGLKGTLRPEGYMVNISPRQVRRYLESHPQENFQPAGCRFQVRLTEFRSQDGRDFFAAELVEQI